MSVAPSLRLVGQPTLSDAHSAASMESVEVLMMQLAAGRPLETCGAMVVEHLTTGGKRLRARLALAATAALMGSESPGVAWAAACELLHNASLVHDDLQDGDRMRRGSETLWVRHGKAQAINAGDLMLMLPTLALDALDTDNGKRWVLARALAAYAAQTVRGQSMEMTLLGARRMGWADYLTSVGGKTAAFFGLPVYGAAILAGRTEADAHALAVEFERIGVLFQIQDDVIDLFGQKGRESAGADVREGKVSALVVEHLFAFPEDAAWLLHILDQPRGQTTDRQVQQVIRRFRDSGTLEEVLERIYDLAQATYQSEVLAGEPALRTVAVATLDRVLAPVRQVDPSLPVDISGVGVRHV